MSKNSLSVLTVRPFFLKCSSLIPDAAPCAPMSMQKFPMSLRLCCSDLVKNCARCFSSHTSLERSVFFHPFLDSRLAKSNGKNSRLSFEQAFVHDHTSFQNSMPCALLAHQFLGTAASVGSASGRPFVNKLGAAPYSKAASTCSSSAW